MGSSTSRWAWEQRACSRSADRRDVAEDANSLKRKAARLELEKQLDLANAQRENARLVTNYNKMAGETGYAISTTLTMNQTILINQFNDAHSTNFVHAVMDRTNTITLFGSESCCKTLATWLATNGVSVQVDDRSTSQDSNKWTIRFSKNLSRRKT